MGNYNSKTVKSKNPKSLFNIIAENDDAPLFSDKARKLFGSCKADVTDIMVKSISDNLDKVDKLKFNLNSSPKTKEEKDNYIKQGMEILQSNYKDKTIKKAIKNFEESSNCIELMEHFKIKKEPTDKRKNNRKKDE